MFLAHSIVDGFAVAQLVSWVHGKVVGCLNCVVEDLSHIGQKLHAVELVEMVEVLEVSR